MNAQEKFRENWVRWQPVIYGYIRTLVFHRADAEDILQKVAAILWQKIDQYEEGTHFNHWACQVARNVVLNHRKTSKRQRISFSSEMIQLLAEEETDSEQSREELDALESCIEKLPPAQRALVRQRYSPGATNRSLAASKGLSESALSRTLARIRRALARCIYQTLGETIPGEVNQ